MAVTKTHPIKSTLKAAIDYICKREYAALFSTRSVSSSSVCLSAR